MATPTPKRVLIIVSDAKSFPIEKDGKTVAQPSGYFLTELAKPLSKLLEAGYEVTFASPRGEEPKPDPNSESLLAFAGNFLERRRENELVERMKRENGFATPRRLADVRDDELAGFAGLFIPGGHAPLSDLGHDPDCARILRHFHKFAKPTAAICHGPYAFLSTCRDGEFAYKGYKITSWSDAEEGMMETLLGGKIPKVEAELREAGAEMVEGVKEKVGVITVDREVVSGGNPLAADALGDKFLQMLEGGA